MGSDMWVNLVKKDNNNIDPTLYRSYREGLKEAVKNRDICMASPEDYYWPNGITLKSKIAKNALAGVRNDGLPDVRDWKKHPMTIADSADGCTCGADQVPIALILKLETFYNTQDSSDLSISSSGQCFSIMSLLLNYYQLGDDCKAPKPNDNAYWKPGFLDTLGYCYRSGQATGDIDTETLRDGDWYIPPECNAVRIIGQEEEIPWIAKNSCRCCGNYEYRTITKGVKVFAGHRPIGLTDAEKQFIMDEIKRKDELAKKKAAADLEKKNKKETKLAICCHEAERRKLVERTRLIPLLTCEDVAKECDNEGTVLVKPDKKRLVKIIDEKNSISKAYKEATCSLLIKLNDANSDYGATADIQIPTQKSSAADRRP